MDLVTPKSPVLSCDYKALMRVISFLDSPSNQISPKKQDLGLASQAQPTSRSCNHRLEGKNFNLKDIIKPFVPLELSFSDDDEEDRDRMKKDGDRNKEFKDRIKGDGDQIKEDEDQIKEDEDRIKEDEDLSEEDEDLIKEDGNLIKDDNDDDKGRVKVDDDRIKEKEDEPKIKGVKDDTIIKIKSETNNTREKFGFRQGFNEWNHLSCNRPPLTNTGTQTETEAPLFRAPNPIPPPVAFSALKEMAPTKMFRVNGKPYVVMNCLGKGGSSKVYQVYENGRNLLMALKVVQLKDLDANTEKCFRNEIDLLRKLQGCRRVVKLYDFEFRESEKILYILMEKGDTDLVSVLRSAFTNGSLDPIDCKFYWSEMLKAVAEIHQAGIIHLDLKPANFIQVMGRLKLIDFGIASSVQKDMTSCMRDNPLGTLNYMAPEALQASNGLLSVSSQHHMTVRTRSDVWSLGCILFHMVFGRNPFQHIPQIFQKIQAITNPNYVIQFPTNLEDKQLLEVLQSCFQRDPLKRPTIQELLRHSYLTNSKSAVTVDHLIGQIGQLSPKSKQRIADIFKR